jgi:hypothetical protein
VWEKVAVGKKTAWEKAAVGNKTETEKKKIKTRTEKTMEGTWKTVVVNEKTEWESLYQNHCNTRQTDGRIILYNLKQKKMNREQEQRLVY